MKKQNFLKHILCALFLVIGFSAFAENVNVTITAEDALWTSTADAQSGSKGGITIETTNGLCNGHYRVYKGKTFTVTSVVGKIKKMKITCTASGDAQYGPGCFTDATSGTYTYSDKVGTWEGDADSFTLTASSNQVRMTELVITYESSGAAVAPTLTAGGTYYGASKEITITNNESGATVYYTMDGNNPTTSSSSFTGTSKALTLTETQTTVKAMAVVSNKANSTVTSATYNLLPSIANSKETAYTVDQIKAIIDEKTTAQLSAEKVYVKGKVSKVDSYNETYHSITYWLDENTFEVYGGKGLNNTNFTDINGVVVGADVIVYGNVKKFTSSGNTIYEFDKDNYLVEYTIPEGAKRTPTITATYRTVLVKGASDVYDVTVEGNGELSVTSSAEDVATASVNGNSVTVTSKKAGTTKITLSSAETNEYLSGQKEYTLSVIEAAELPFVYDGKGSEISSKTGMSQNSVGDYGYSPAIKFDGTGDEVVICYNASATSLGYIIKGNSYTDGQFDVMESTDGITYTTLKSYANLNEEGKTTGKATLKEVLDLKSASRFVKFIFTTKTAGNVALGNINIVNGHIRAIASDGYYTICLPNEVPADKITGAKVYDISGVRKTGDNVTAVALREVTENLPAGRPFIIEGTSDMFAVSYTGEATSVVHEAVGLVGNLSSTGLDVPQGCYIISSDNKLHKVVGATATVGQYRAYINLENVDEASSSAKEINIFEDDVTGINEVSSLKSQVLGKYLENGRIVIVKNGKKFNTNGQEIF